MSAAEASDTRVAIPPDLSPGAMRLVIEGLLVQTQRATKFEAIMQGHMPALNDEPRPLKAWLWLLAQDLASLGALALERPTDATNLATLFARVAAVARAAVEANGLAEGTNLDPSQDDDGVALFKVLVDLGEVLKPESEDQTHG